MSKSYTNVYSVPYGQRQYMLKLSGKQLYTNLPSKIVTFPEATSSCCQLYKKCFNLSQACEDPCSQFVGSHVRSRGLEGDVLHSNTQLSSQSLNKSTLPHPVQGTLNYLISSISILEWPALNQTTMLESLATESGIFVCKQL
jgi:hypothetical protein